MSEEDAARLVAGLCIPRGLEPNLDNTRQVAIGEIVKLVREHEEREAAEAAAANVESISIA